MITKKEAFDILGLPDDSIQSVVEARYSTLIKRYLAEKNNEKFEEISLAYNVITGKYVEPEKEAPEQNKVILGKSRKQWENIWLYEKYKIIVGILIVAIVIQTIVSFATYTKADFRISTVGYFVVNDEVVVQNYVKFLFPEFKKVDLDSAYLNAAADPGDDTAANVIKGSLLFAYGSQDVIIVDKKVFDEYAKEGAFLPLGELFNEVSAYDEVADLDLSAEKASVIDIDDNPGAEDIYGINLGTSQLCSAFGVIGYEQILVVSFKSKRPDVAKEFIRRLLKDTERLLLHVNPMVTQSVPTPTPEITP